MGFWIKPADFGHAKNVPVFSCSRSNVHSDPKIDRRAAELHHLKQKKVCKHFSIFLKDFSGIEVGLPKEEIWCRGPSRHSGMDKAGSRGPPPPRLLAWWGPRAPECWRTQPWPPKWTSMKPPAKEIKRAYCFLTTRWFDKGPTLVPKVVDRIGAYTPLRGYRAPA